MGAVLDKELQECVQNVRAGAVINMTIVMAAAEGIVKNSDSNLLQCDGGHITIIKSWTKIFFESHGVRKMESIALKLSKVAPADFEAHQ